MHKKVYTFGEQFCIALEQCSKQIGSRLWPCSEYVIHILGQVCEHDAGYDSLPIIRRWEKNRYKLNTTRKESNLL